MPAPYPLALRQRIVDAYLSGETNRKALSRRFVVSYSSVCSFIKQYQETGNLTPLPASNGDRWSVDEKGIVFLEAIISQKPDLTLNEIIPLYKSEFGVTLSSSGLDRNLKRLNISRKKSHSTVLKKKQIELKK